MSPPSAAVCEDVCVRLCLPCQALGSLGLPETTCAKANLIHLWRSSTAPGLKGADQPCGDCGPGAVQHSSIHLLLPTRLLTPLGNSLQMLQLSSKGSKTKRAFHKQTNECLWVAVTGPPLSAAWESLAPQL